MGKKSRALIIIVTLLVLIAIALTVYFFVRTTPEKMVEAFLEGMSSEDYEAAAGTLCKEFFTADYLKSINNPKVESWQISDAYYFEIATIDTTSGASKNELNAGVKATVTYDNGETHSFRFFAAPDCDWKIFNILIDGESLR